MSMSLCDVMGAVVRRRLLDDSSLDYCVKYRVMAMVGTLVTPKGDSFLDLPVLEQILRYASNDLTAEQVCSIKALISRPDLNPQICPDDHMECVYKRILKDLLVTEPNPSHIIEALELTAQLAVSAVKVREEERAVKLVNWFMSVVSNNPSVNCWLEQEGGWRGFITDMEHSLKSSSQSKMGSHEYETLQR